MGELTFPFEPPMEDCKLSFKTASGIQVHVLDTYCKDLTLEEKMRRDTRIYEVYNDILVRSKMREKAAKENKPPSMEAKEIQEDAYIQTKQK